jgi:hypothetical protein
MDRPPIASPALHDRDRRFGQDHRVAGLQLGPGMSANRGGDVVARHEHGRPHGDPLEGPAADDD